MEQAVSLHLRNHIRNIGLRVAFSLPHIKIYIQAGIVLLQVSDGYIQDVAEDRAVTGIALLQLNGRVMSGLRELFVLLGALAGLSGKSLPDRRL